MSFGRLSLPLYGLKRKGWCCSSCRQRFFFFMSVLFLRITSLSRRRSAFLSVSRRKHYNLCFLWKRTCPSSWPWPCLSDLFSSCPSSSSFWQNSASYRVSFCGRNEKYSSSYPLFLRLSSRRRRMLLRNRSLLCLLLSFMKSVYGLSGLPCINKSCIQYLWRPPLLYGAVLLL